MTTLPLKEVDAYAIARTLIKKDLPDTLTISPVTQILVNTIREKGLGFDEVRPILGDHMEQVLAVKADGNFELPAEPHQIDMVPALGDSALTDEKLQLAEKGGGWVNEYVEWARGTANQTPVNYHKAAALWMLGLAIARRLHFESSWAKRVYPADFHLIIGISTYYRKSTAMSMAEGLVKEWQPHLLLPNPRTSEGMLDILTGKNPENWDALSRYDQNIITRGKQFCAQRGLWIEEISSMFKGMSKRDYMSGLKEFWMQAWDCVDSLTEYTKSGGYVYVRDIGINLIGTTTPSELSLGITDTDWTNGLVTRFCLWFPEKDYKEVPGNPTAFPAHLKNQWLALYNSLPDPPKVEAIGGEDIDAARMPSWSVSMNQDALAAMKAYEQDLRTMTEKESGLDDRLRTSYGRLHVHAIRFAIMSAAMRWVKETGGRGKTKPFIDIHDWYWAQSIAEQLRENIHVAMSELSKSYEIILEDRVYGLLRRFPRGLSVRDMYRNLNTTSEKTEKALKNLIADGEVIELEGNSDGRGRRTTQYVLANGA